MIKYAKFLLAIGIFLICKWEALAQKDEIGTEVIHVVKPYSPTISDAFKVKEMPHIDEQETMAKQAVKYTIFSFPVASTFTPTKGKAASVENPVSQRYFKNYAILSGGNYATANAELLLTTGIGSTGYLGAMLRHKSSAGGIRDVALENRFHQSSIDVSYGGNSQKISYTADLGYSHQAYNWYGLPADIGASLDAASLSALLNQIDPVVTYQQAFFGGSVRLDDSFFKEAGVQYRHFWDGEEVVEDRVIFKPKFAFSLGEAAFKATLLVDHLTNNLPSAILTANRFSFTNVGVLPSVSFNKDKWSIQAGIALFYSITEFDKGNRLYIYPQINAAIDLLPEKVIFYAGLEGGLEQNALQELTISNPYLSPGQIIAPTDKQYTVFAGLKGKLVEGVSYTVRGAYGSEKNKPFFTANNYNVAPNQPSYGYGNSFSLIYDDLRTLSLYGEVKAHFFNKLTVGLNSTYSSFDTSNLTYAWNLPQFSMGSSIDFEISQKWRAGVDAFLVGKRKDVQDFLESTANPAPPVITTLDSYFDLNTAITYKHNERLTGFIKANNMLNQNYQRWLNFPVQGLLIMAGGSYQFDF